MRLFMRNGMGFQEIIPVPEGGSEQMCVIMREILPQVVVCIIDRLIHINIKIGYIVC